MTLIIGLGNPGANYEDTRHNIGYKVIDELLRHKLPSDLIAKKTGVFMNNSGSEVKTLITNYNLPITNLYIIHDDLDLPLGQFKIQFGKGPKVHNGVNSIEETLGTSEFWRVRVGVDNRDPENRTPGDKYVLQDFDNKEKLIIDEMVMDVVQGILYHVQQTK